MNSENQKEAKSDSVFESSILQCEFDELRKQVQSKDKCSLIGLAFSGGGIRSATLNLGVLQGLAKHNLLTKFDYLSTVSGGGYIGAWFSALIHRNCGISRVEKELKESILPKSTNQSNTEKAIDWLRSYSNFLTPKKGLFTTDTLAAFTQWTNNAILNQIMLVAWLLMVFILLNTLIFNSYMPTNPTQISFHQIANWLISTFDRLLGDRRYWFWLGVTLFASSLLYNMVHTGFIELVAKNQKKIKSTLQINLRDLYDKYHSLFEHPKTSYFIGAIGIVALLIFSNVPIKATCWFTLNKQLTSPPNFIVGLGLPLITLCISLLSMIVIGILGRELGNQAREYWYRLGGINIAFSITWLFLFACCAWIPYLIYNKFSIEEVNIENIVGVITYLIALLTALLGKSKVSTDANASDTVKILTKIMPYVAIALIFLCLGYASYRMYLSNYTTCWFFACFSITVIGSWRFDINTFSLHNFYRYRLARCYLGASNPEREKTRNSFTDFAQDDIWLASLQGQRPMPIINTALNICDGSELAWQQRKAAAFFFTPYHSGFELPILENAHRQKKSGFIPTKNYVFKNKNGPFIGSLIATSGAAASPNMGYHTNPVLAFIMTIFNARLGRWFGNPNNDVAAKKAFPLGNLAYLLTELFAGANADSDYLYLSDGGHFENLGIYELVRRKCKLIIAIDAGEDGKYEFEDLGNAIRKCKLDLGAEITINVDQIFPTEQSAWGDVKLSKQHFAIGTIDYGDDFKGILVYVKSSLTKNTPADLINYKLQEFNFPHHSTIDQFFNESQFESYRHLGQHIAETTIRAFEGTYTKSKNATKSQKLTEEEVMELEAYKVFIN